MASSIIYFIISGILLDSLNVFAISRRSVVLVTMCTVVPSLGFWGISFFKSVSSHIKYHFNVSDIRWMNVINALAWILYHLKPGLVA